MQIDHYLILATPWIASLIIAQQRGKILKLEQSFLTEVAQKNPNNLITWILINMSLGGLSIGLYYSFQYFRVPIDSLLFWSGFLFLFLYASFFVLFNERLCNQIKYDLNHNDRKSP